MKNLDTINLLFNMVETAQHSFERGAETHNMGGIENNLEGGLFNFKI